MLTKPTFPMKTQLRKAAEMRQEDNSSAEEVFARLIQLRTAPPDFSTLDSVGIHQACQPCQDVSQSQRKNRSTATAGEAYDKSSIVIVTGTSSYGRLPGAPS